MATGLKSSIVVVNQYTISDSSGRGGSRGGTPGAYVTRYMAREDAIEQISPVARTDLDDFVTKYMARADAVETVMADHRNGHLVMADAPTTRGYDAPTLAARRVQRSVRRALRRAGPNGLSRAELAERLSSGPGDGGVAFGHAGVSLSHERLHADAAMIQDLFDAGHTVLKTVISFDHDYLVSNGLVPGEMALDSSGAVPRGGYRGNLDQLKLRMAVMEGLGRMARLGGFDDLRYVGVIQVDTAHVHCHLALVDAGRGRLAADGTQRGKLSAADMGVLRRGLDDCLDRHQRVAHLSSAVGHERRNVAAYVKRWAYESLSLSARAQFVLACLPADRRLWRAASNATEMLKPNRLVRTLVTEHLARPGSPLPAAMEQVRDYAEQRRIREGLSRAEYQRLIDDGRERMMVQACNGVYTVLASVADDELTVSTPMLSVMSADLDELVSAVAEESGRTRDRGRSDEINAGQFALRLRAYTERCERHRALREEYLLRARAWERADEAGAAAPGSEAMHRHYLVEADYHGRCLSKYQYYLDLTTADTGEWASQWATVESYGRALSGLRALRADKSLMKMSNPQAAEQLGREIYGQHGGALMAATGPEGQAGRAILDSRLESMGKRYRRQVDELVSAWRASGPGVRIRLAPPGTDRHEHEQTVTPGVAGAMVTDPYADPGAAVLVTTAPEHPFELVKGLDMHELGLDWPTDQEVGPRCAARHEQMSTRRASALDSAAAWMIATGQGGEVDQELGAASADIDRALRVSAQITASGKLPSLLALAAARIAERRAQKQAAEQAASELLDLQAAAERRYDAAERDALEAFLLESADGHRPKRRGFTARIDSGLGGAVNASVDAVVSTWRPDAEQQRTDPAQ